MFGLLGLLTEVIASNADGTRGLVDVLMFSSRITALGLWRLSSSLFGAWPGFGAGTRGGGSVILSFCIT